MFTKKTPAEFEALTEYQKEKYLDEKAAHETKVATEAATKAANEAIETMKAELKKERDADFDKIKADNELALVELGKKYDVSMEEMKATLKRAKIGEINTRMKGISEQIVDKLSTEEGEGMIKAFFTGQREKLSVELGESEIKALVIPVNAYGAEYAPIVGPGHRQIHARNVIPVLPTTSGLIRFLQYVLDTTAGTGFGTTAVGAQKPTINYIGTVKEAAVRKIAGLIDVPDEYMDDVVGFRAWIAYELPKAYMDAEDLQIFKGNGVGENLLGLWYQANFQSLPLGSVTSASNTIDKIIAGVTQVRKLNRNTSAVFLSPVEYMEMLINKGTTNEYTYPVIMMADGTATLGGVPIYWSTVFADGEGLVGDFDRGTVIFQRMAMNIAYSGENKDNFEKNVVSIRLEGRIALPIYYPEAFLKLFVATS